MPTLHRRMLYFLFTLSGFSGLIYESIWSHYLKLYLGHAAYAQSLVLVLFMGGMAMGAMMTSARIARITNPLMVYAAVEGCIGLLGLMFHPAFVAISDWSFSTVIPQLGSAVAVQLFRWGVAACLLLPASALLGSTFPLMATAVLRRQPGQAGQHIATLYFTNSIGASLGGLLTGFFLIGALGLPGTIMLAAGTNILVAVIAYSVAGDLGPSRPVTVATDGAMRTLKPGLIRLLLLCSAITGLSSFMYEVGWIRMLTLVLGASTHAFELMLSSFILGIALGGLWIRGRIEHFANPLGTLALVQLLMGLLALLSLPAYGLSFGIMIQAIQVLNKNDPGYIWFNIISNSICLLVMLPVTFMAGMTLPLISHILVRRGSGEKALGHVYGVNTLGAIAGTLLTVWVLMPLCGLKLTIIAGATLDIALALLIWQGQRQRRTLAMASALAAVCISVALFAFSMDARKMASGVFRTGTVLEMTPLFHRDGRTASIDVFSFENGTRVISTNGKPDASIGPNGMATGDEPTMALLGLLPLMMHPSPRQVAVIGMGSGMTGATMLLDPRIHDLDMIELEPAMIEGAKVLSDRATPLFTDPRSHIHVDDAKSFFATSQKHYDIIVSEPSNPWVSGISGLFSVEFYQRIHGYMAPGGYLVQWLHVYETNRALMGSVINAMHVYFPEYEIWASNSGDIIIVAARDKGTLFNPRLEQAPAAVRAGMANIFVSTQEELMLHRIGSSSVLSPFMVGQSGPLNSDYYPYVDVNAVRARFLNQAVADLIPLRASDTVFLNMVEHRPPVQGPVVFPGHPNEFEVEAWAHRAQGLYSKLLAPAATVSTKDFTPQDLRQTLIVGTPDALCTPESLTWVWLPEFVQYAEHVLPYLGTSEMDPILEHLRQQSCWAKQDPLYLNWISLVHALAHNDADATWHLGRQLRPDGRSLPGPLDLFVVKALLAADLALGRLDDAQHIMASYRGPQEASLEVLERIVVERSRLGAAGR